MDGDFVVWRPERKAREVRVSVYDAELRKYHVLRLSIDTTLGCLLQIDSERTEKEKLISKMPKEYVTTSLCLFVSLNLLRVFGYPLGRCTPSASYRLGSKPPLPHFADGRTFQ